MVYRKESTTRLRASDELTGEGVVPGFRCRVSELFPALEGFSDVTPPV
jgi:hypothetical protein